MKRMTKGLSVLIAIILIVTAVPLNGFVGIELPDFFSFKAKAETNSNEFLTSGFCGDTSEGGDGKNISWTLDENGVLTITGTGKMAPEAFNYDLRIKEVVISDGITNISSYCFNECANLTKVTMGNDIEEIGISAFRNCKKLVNVDFSDSLITIGNYAFGYCISLTNLDFPDSLITLGNGAFIDCDEFTNIIIPDSVTTIGQKAFSHNDNLTRVEFPKSLVTIGNSAFSYCSKLTDVVFANSPTTIDIQAFSGCYSLVSITIPDSFTEIRNYAFRNCSKLETVTIGAGVTSIRTSAFSECSGLCSIEVSENNQTYSSVDGVLYNKSKTEIILVPSAISGEITLPAAIEEFTYSAVDNCSGLIGINVETGSTNYKSVDGIVYSADGKTLVVCPRGREGTVTIADGTEIIGKYAFRECKITSIIFSDSITTIERDAFYYCTSLVSAELSNSLTTIGDSAFYYCYKLTSIDLPDSLTEIGDLAFNLCYALTNVDFPETLVTIGDTTFGSCKSFTSVSLPDSLTTIGSNVFKNCTKLETVTIGAGLSNIEENVFTECNSLSTIVVSEENQTYSSHDGILYNKAKTELILVPLAIAGEVTIPATVESFSYAAVDGCTKLTGINVEEESHYYKSVDGMVYSADGKKLIVCPRGKQGTATIYDGTEIILEYAFYECDELLTITFSDTVKIIERYAFYSCSKLENVDFSDSLTTIGLYAFMYCSNITSLTFPEKLTTINVMAFYYCSGLTSVLLPDSLTTIGGSAFSDCVNLKKINIPPAIRKLDSSMFNNCGFIELVLPETVQSFNKENWTKLETLTIENKYCEYTSTLAPSFGEDCTIRAYCGSPGHELAVKRLLNFESLGHTYLDWYVYEPATFEAEGIERRDCAYCDGYEERPIPKLEADVFTATFVADGETVATVEFPKGATEITEPAVPAKDRYMGEWEEYTLNDADITINAVYTLIKSEDASDIETDSEVIHYTDKDDVLFRFRAWADATIVKSTVSKSVPLDIVLVVDQSGSMDETLGAQIKKVDALKDTAKDFVNTVCENAKMTEADHRISIVGFGLSGDYRGYEKNENTELLTSANGVVKFDNINTTDYASSLISVNENGKVNNALITAIDSIEARGATAADLGFEMAKAVFANTDSTDRQRVVIFMTDGEPTHLSGFDMSVANSAIENASVLKKTYDASIYSVGVFSDTDRQNSRINSFMNAVSSGYPDAVSMDYIGTGAENNAYYLTVSNTDSLTSVFKTISTESLSHTAPFDNLTVIKTLSKYVTLSSRQEEQLRVDLIRKYGITNEDIIITRNEDGTTTIQINGLTPYETTDEEGNVIYEVSVEFFASLNENASSAGEYVVDTEDSGVMLGSDAKGYEATFDTSSITLDSDKTRIIFTINGEVYDVSEEVSDGYPVAPEIEIAEDWQFSGWDTTSQEATNGLVLDATLTKAQRTVTWHTADGDVVQKYFMGDIITPPEVGNNSNGDTFLSWDKSIPTTMPDENLEFNAVYGGHVHNYTSEVTKEMTCEENGVRTFTCQCGDSYTEEITATGHDYKAITPSLEKDDSKCTFVCVNCGNKYEYALEYKIVEKTSKKSRVLYEFNLTDENISTNIQPDGTIQIKIPLSELHGSAEKVTVIRTNEDGTKTKVPAVHEKGFLIITCDHFSPYEVIFDVTCSDHDACEWVTIKEASYASDGLRHLVCEECNTVYDEEVISAKTLVTSLKGQIRFLQNADGSYANKFDVRAIAVISQEDFISVFGSNDNAVEMIKDFGFVFAAGGNVAHPDIDDVKAIVENGESVDGYTKKTCTRISTGISAGNYAFTCLVTNIPDAEKDNSLVAIGYMAWDSDGDGKVDSYAYYPTVQKVSFTELHDKYYPLAAEKFGW